MTDFSSIFETLRFYLEFPFVRYALIVGVLIALCSSLFGVTLVLKRYSFIGDGISHVAFGAMSVATIFDLASDTIIIMPVTILAAILLLRTGQNTKIKEMPIVLSVKCTCDWLSCAQHFLHPQILQEMFVVHCSGCFNLTLTKTM